MLVQTCSNVMGANECSKLNVTMHLLKHPKYPKSWSPGKIHQQIEMFIKRLFPH